jgi:PAS domain S-box-containing protein
MVNRPGTRPISAYAAAALLTLIALVTTQVLQREVGFQSFLLLIPVVIFTSARWGAVIGAFSGVLATVGITVLMAPRGSFFVADPADRARVFAFVAVAAVCIWLASKQQHLAQELRANEAELRAIFDLAAVGTGMVNPRTGRFLRVNGQLCSMTGYTREELLQKTVPDITHPDDRERDREIIAALMSGRIERWSTEKRYLHKNGGAVWVLVNGTIVRGEDGEPAHMIAHAADITDRRRADDALREANRLKDEFLATLSHELRTPLNVVVGWTHILSREETPPHIKKALAVIARNTDALRRLTDDLIGLSSVLTGRVRLDRHLIDLRAILDDAVESVSLAAAAKGLSLVKQIDGRLLVLGDESRLRQVFWNLLSNAVKFTQPGGTITVATHPEGERISIQVADTGIGIPSSFLPHVFDKFRQEDSSHTREHQGLGLGLAIAHQFTELHGGTISVHSEGRNRGTAFTVTLPSADVSAATSSSELSREPRAVRFQ